MEMKKLKELWDQLGDIPVNGDGEIDEPFLDFDVGTDREDIWNWFEEQNNDFVVGDIMNGKTKIDDSGETKILAIYDNGGDTLDRYTVVYDNEWHIKTGYEEDKLYECLSMSDNPTHPQGIGQHSSCQDGDHLGKKIKFEDLPLKCQEVVNRDLGKLIDTLIDKLDKIQNS